MKKISLVKMKSGAKGVVFEIVGGQLLQNRLMSMGIYPGKEITKQSHFAMRGPVTINAGNAREARFISFSMERGI